MRKLQLAKSKLKEWNKKSLGELKERKKSILTNIASIDAIEHEGNLSPKLSVQRVFEKRGVRGVIVKRRGA